MAAEANKSARPEREATPQMYRVQDVEAILDIARPTIYELARRDPELLGAVRFGRLVRFRREVVDGLATGKRV